MGDTASVERHDPTYGWEPSVPEPFWVRRGWLWRRRWVPACYSCSMRQDRSVEFSDRDEWAEHWLREHRGE